MSDQDEQNKAMTLCKACGLCCTGHLFSWAKLKSSELKSARALGLQVLGSDPNQRGFNQPCPLWDGECTIYDSPHYPHFCRLYKCKLLKNLLDETIRLPDALLVVQQAKDMIAELESRLPVSSTTNFRERLIAHTEQDTSPDFQQRARDLLLFYKNHFGVKDLVDHLDETDFS